MTQKQEAVRDKYSKLALTKDAKEVEQYPILDEAESMKMQEEFIKANNG